jgi:hypothetical protein
MNNYNENVLKYLSGLMTNDEIIRFEEEIKNSPELKDRLDNARTKIMEMGRISEIPSDEAYFNNLIPLVHERNARLKSKNYFTKIAYSLPVTIVLAVVILLGIFNKSESLLEFENFDNLIIESLFDRPTAERLYTEIETYNYFSSLYAENAIPNIYVDDNKDYDSNEEYYSGTIWNNSNLESLSDDEVNQLLLKLDNINLQRGTK